MIQKVYRGFRIRKHLREHLRHLLVEEMIASGEDLSELYNIGLGPYIENHISNQNKKPSKISNEVTPQRVTRNTT